MKIFSPFSNNRSHHHEWHDRRVKDAVGVLIGNDKLRAEGKTHQAVGEVKQVAEKAVDRVKQAVKKERD